LPGNDRRFALNLKFGISSAVKGENIIGSAIKVAKQNNRDFTLIVTKFLEKNLDTKSNVGPLVSIKSPLKN
jgi:hypothetical protein